MLVSLTTSQWNLGQMYFKCTSWSETTIMNIIYAFVPWLVHYSEGKPIRDFERTERVSIECGAFRTFTSSVLPFTINTV